MTTEIFLPALAENDLDWKDELALARKVVEEGGKILWQMDLGIDTVLEPMTDEAIFQQRALALTTFSKVVFPLFAEKSAGIVIASSELYRSIARQDEWEDDFEGLEEPFRTHLKAMTVFADYVHRLASFLPDELQAIVRIDAQSATDLGDIAFLLSKERFRHLSLEVSGWFPQEGTLGFVIPEDMHYGKRALEEVNEVFSWLQEKNIKFRLLPEMLLNEEWNGLNTLIMMGSFVSPVGKRKARGFVAAGGDIISYGVGIGIDGEVVLERNRSRGIRTPDLLLPKQPR